ncbi:Ig-like domain-containing protein, partial [Candidatus Bipolaricaulota bacterium]
MGTDNDGSDGWSLTYAFTSVGSKSITAEYSGDGVYSGSTSAAITQTVSKLDVTLTITGDAPDPSAVGQSYTVTWSTTTNDPDPGTAPFLTPGGAVLVTDGDPAVTCTTDVTIGGCGLASITAGIKTLAAQYAGDANFNSASATTSHQVNPGSVSIAITPSHSPWNSGSSGTFTAAVTAIAPATGTPSGTVTFLIKDQFGVTIDTSGPHLLVAGSATSDPVSLTYGQSPVSVEVSYSGDVGFSPATTTPPHYSQVVAGAPIAGDFTITSHTPNPIQMGNDITVNVAYSGGFPDDGDVEVLILYPPGSCATSSTLAVSESDTTAGPFLVSTSADSNCEAGTWDITATYTPDAGDVETDTVSHTLFRCTTSTDVTFSPSSVYVNQPTTLTATVTPIAPPTPACDATGLVGQTVSFASKNLPTGADGDFSSEYCILVGGAGSAFCSTVTYTPTASGADCSTSSAQAHTLVSSFAGGDYLASSSEATLTVLKRPPVVSLTCVPDSVYVDEETTCTVVVFDSTVAPGSTIPTGTTTFDDASKAGGFSPSDTGSLVHGTYAVDYTPAAGDAGTSTATTTVSVDYGGSSVYCEGDSTAALEVKVRPTETTLSWKDSAGGNDAIYLYETGT